MSAKNFAKEKKKEKSSIPVTKDTIYELDITGLGTGGEGVGKIEGFTVFVPFALPGERVKAIMETVKKTYAKGRLLAVVRPSKDRTSPRCPVYEECGGCQLQHVSYEAQLKLKTQMVKDMVERIGQIDPRLVKPAIGPKEPWYYRNKMQMPVSRDEHGIVMGFYERGSHKVVHCLSCAIQKEGNNHIAQVCHTMGEKLGIEPYNEITHTGVLRHIIGRIGCDEYMVILVTATPVLPNTEEWVEGICKALPKVTSIIHNYNPNRTNVILGEKTTVLWGKEQITDTIGNTTFLLSAQSFFQVNPAQTSVLYNQALNYAELTGRETVIDAYCGTGTISLLLAQKAKKVIGIEIVEPAILDARENARRNGVTNTEFIVGDAAIEMPKLLKKGIRPDVIVFDPIRAGCKEEVLEAAVSMEPKRIVYVSCNPATMARDIRILEERGYKTIEVQPVDMFPQTAHVECVVLLQRSNG